MIMFIARRNLAVSSTPMMMMMIVAVFWLVLVMMLLVSPVCLAVALRSTSRENGGVSLLTGSIPAPAQYYDKQLVDHLQHHRPHYANNNNSLSSTANYSKNIKKFWTQRYYIYDKHFQGPGHAIFLIMGGEGAIEPSSGIYYPLIAERYAAVFGAYVLQPEHRFYGASQPIARHDIDTARRLHLVDPRVQLLTSEQALRDAVRLLQYTRFQVLKCSRDRFSPTYCPVVIVGGSYPGFLAAMGRLRFPHIIDMAYAASAPIQFYAQQINETTHRQYDYYDHITNVADAAYPGCAEAVSSTLSDFKSYYYNNHHSIVGSIDTSAIGICNGTLPSYIIHGGAPNKNNTVQTFIDEVIMMVGYTFANANMAYYPPTNASNLYQACAFFSKSHNNDNDDNSRIQASLVRLKDFLVSFLGDQHQPDCFDMTQQLPTGLNATISAGDWSGVGPKSSGESWDFQTCTLLVEAIGFGPDSMFATTAKTTTTTVDAAATAKDGTSTAIVKNTRSGRDWSLDWLTRHCQDRFGAKVVPRPHALVDAWHFDPEHLVKIGGASRIIFTNGLNDGWSVSGIKSDLSNDVLVINFPNGAHHSDLNGMGNQSTDTIDIQQGTRRIQDFLATWLAELPSSLAKTQQ
jgi:Serine carboxypeptidase S28